LASAGRNPQPTPQPDESFDSDNNVEVRCCFSLWIIFLCQWLASLKWNCFCRCFCLNYLCCKCFCCRKQKKSNRM